MQIHLIPVFREWIPEWLARTLIFGILMTSLFSFAAYSSPAAVMGYYGVEPADVQYGMVITYGSAVTFLALDFRIVKYFTSRKYLLTGLILNSVSSLACFYSKSWILFLLSGFVQGIACALLCSIVLQMTFPRLHSTRARIIGYTLLYAGIQISVPFYAIYSSIMLQFFDFNWLFYGQNVVLMAMAVIVWVTMNAKARFHKKFPLFQVDWAGYFFYTLFCLTLGYILVYGRQSGWFDSSVITVLSIFAVVLLTIFIAREMSVKRPLINLRIFRTGNCIIGLLLLVVFYIFKGTTGLTYAYVETILKTDPLHTIPMWISVIMGTVLSMFVTSRLLLSGTPLVRLILSGFVIMALYYFYMLEFVSVTGDSTDFIFPLFIYGVATGVLFVPIVTFTASAAPPSIAFNASLIGIFSRFVGFCISIAINNQVQLLTKSSAREQIRESVEATNSRLPLVLEDIRSSYLNAGNDVYNAQEASQIHFNSLIKEQILIRATRDYYYIMLAGLLCILLILFLLPKIRKVVLNLRKGNIPY
ncbi:MFS transporter [Chryseobacterium pennipullorum]|uniref:MFS transporter n=1 Tax=Chryseobacterium pennipullorum TaxID=2258963 RepID=A0A3D9B1W2_9FLAO|nr:MFS transporter [Chryseobacterium pennipullorum]REC47499.1 hypothetical protein DRF67_10685 [Chryseobacterium pennipullorum]